MECVPRSSPSQDSAAPSAAARRPMWVFLLRHGQAQHNVIGGSRGHELPDPVLTELGLQQALRVQLQVTEFDAVFFSPLRRAIQTTIAIFGEKQVSVSRSVFHVDALLLEKGAGTLPCDTGSDTKELESEFPVFGLGYFSGMLKPRYHHPKIVLAERATRFRAVLKEFGVEERDDGLSLGQGLRVLIVAHGGVLAELSKDPVVFSNCEMRQYEFWRKTGELRPCCERSDPKE